MKLNKILLAGAIAVSTAVSAFATTPDPSNTDATVKIFLTGSTAFRAGANQAIYDLLHSTGSVGYVGTGAFSTSGLQGATYVTAYGTVGGVSVAIYTDWTGSEAGIASVAAKSPTAITAWNSNSTIGTTAGTQVVVTTPVTFTAVANTAMADNAQNESNNHGTNFNTLVASQVGVVPFVWIKGTSNNTTVQSSLNNLANMTAQQAQLVLTNNGTPLSFWTGNSGDSYNIYPLGRDNGSGTRLNTMLESYLAAKGSVNNSVTNYVITSAISGGTINSLPAAQASAGGYGSGGTLCADLTNPVANGVTDGSVPFAFVGYAGVADVASKFKNAGLSYNGATGVFTWAPTGAYVGTSSPVLSYNGTPFSLANISNGSYTFWGYEYMGYISTIDTPSSNFLTNNFLPQMQADIESSNAGFQLAHVSAQRAGAGQLVTP